MANITDIISDIKDTVAPLMNKWVDDRTAYVMNIRNVRAKFESSDDYATEYLNLKTTYHYLTNSNFMISKLIGKGYTKGDIQLSLCNNSDICLKIEKDAASMLAKIDVAVKKKITFEVNSVEKLFVEHGKDGYIEGAWKLNGEKIFSFDTIYAGGYNIQCLHVRTKYKLK